MDRDAVSDTQASCPPMPRHLVDLEDGGAVRHLTEPARRGRSRS